MAEYTPDDDHMRSLFCQGYARGDFPKFDEAHLAWTNWLAAHDARVKRDAAREALDGLAKAEMDRVASLGKHSYPAQIAQGIAQAAWSHKWKNYGGAHPEEAKP